MMKLISKTLVLALLVLVSCNNPAAEKETAPPPESALEEANSTETPAAAETEASPPMTEQATEIAPGRLAGEHPLTLQWISWDKPGTITFTTIGEDTYRVEGRQEGVKGDECPFCYLTVEGTITEVDPKRLRFTGKIETSVHHIQDGEPCVKEGTFDFVASGNRQYWRCQNQQGCEGVTDYVDIYF